MDSHWLVLVSLTDIPREAKIGIGTVAAIIGVAALAVLIGSIIAKKRRKKEEEEEDRMMERYLEQEQTKQDGKENQGHGRNKSMGMRGFLPVIELVSLECRGG